MADLIDKLLELESKSTSKSIVYKNMDDTPVSNPDLLLHQELVNNIRPLLLRMKALEEVARAARDLYDNHEECNGCCEDCMEDGRGTHAEQLDTALNKLDKYKARRG
jgi:hypothetical protein